MTLKFLVVLVGLLACAFASSAVHPNRFHPLFESSEHQQTGDDVVLQGLDNTDPKTSIFTLDNGAQATYRDIIALSGDFYNNYNARPGSPDISQCGDAKQSLFDRQSSFKLAFETMNNDISSVGEINGWTSHGILGDFADEAASVLSTGDFNQNLNYALDIGIRYGLLAIQNMDHFQPCAEQVYEAGHKLAMQTAITAGQQLTATDKKKMLTKAYAMNAFADVCYFS